MIKFQDSKIPNSMFYSLPYCNILDTKVASFRKKSIRVQKTIHTVNNAFDTSSLEAALGSLETIITPYQDAVTNMENIFMKDRWG
jgi:hypothetical protein